MLDYLAARGIKIEIEPTETKEEESNLIVDNAPIENDQTVANNVEVLSF